MAKIKIEPVQNLRGDLEFPGDKSISHRALILTSIADGVSRISNASSGDDVLRTLKAMKMLGVKIKTGRESIVKGNGLHGLKEPENIINAGNSGTTARLLTGLLSAQRFFSSLTGDSSLRRRPMDRVIKPLNEMGADIAGRENNLLLPLAIKGRALTGRELTVPVASAQVKSALLIAGLYARGRTVITQPAPSRDHTERMLRLMGADVEVDGRNVSISGVDRLSAKEISIPGDISSAAFFIVAGTILKGSSLRLRNVGLNPFRTGIINVLRRMGASIKIVEEKESYEPCGTLIVRHSHLKGTRIEGDEIPRLIDEIPVIAVAAAVAEGETVIRNAGELRKKESDRISSMVTELKRFGVDIQELEDGMVIKGGRLRGTHCYSHKDHRIGMALAIAGLAAKGETVIEGSEWIDISFPEFKYYLKKLLKYH